MKKTTLFTFLILFIATFVKAQTAVDDFVLVCQFGGEFAAHPLDNDQALTGNIDYTSLDLDQTLPGVQSSVVINSITFTADATGMVTWNTMGIGSIIINYSFSDDSGNLSNVAGLRIYFDPTILVASDDFGDVLGGTQTSQSVLANDFVSDGQTAYNFGAVLAFENNYPGFSMTPDGYINIDPSVPQGSYTLIYRAFSPYCPSDSWSNSVTLNVVTPCWKSVSMGDFYTTAIKGDGTLWAWGGNGLGELGIGNTIDSNYPIQVGTDSDWAFIAVGDHHTLAIKNNGTLWAWGSNQFGQLGDGTTTDRYSPVQIGTDTDWKYASANYGNSAAIKTNNTLWSWGDNSDGSIGNGNNINQLNPVQITSNSDWSSVSVGDAHTVAIKNSGALWAWGFNDSGQLGDASNNTSNIPVQSASSAGNQWKSVSASRAYTLAIRNDGTLWAWGDNMFEQLGDGTTINRNVPIQVGTDNNWDKIAAGYFHRLAIKTDGTLWAWGSNTRGELGDGTIITKTQPIQVGTDNNWTMVSAKYGSSSAIKSDGSLWVWGANDFGQLGDGTNNIQLIPMNINCSSLQLSDYAVRSEILIYPNPTNNLITISSNDAIFKEIEIHDLNGRIIKSSKHNSSVITLNIEDLANGVYFLNVISENKKTVHKIIKK